MAEVEFEVQNHLSEDIEIRSSIGADFVVRAGQASFVNLPADPSKKIWVIIGPPGEPLAEVPEPLPEHHEQEPMPEHQDWGQAE